jgi:hypothetical protein
MKHLLGTILRGLRSRTLLSAGSVLLTALAIGSAILGPIFAEAVTNSYVVTRLGEAPASATGVTRFLQPDPSLDVPAARDAAVRESDARNDGPWGASVTTAESVRYSALRGVVRFWAREDACDTLEIEGACPSAPGEVLMLNTDLERTGARIGEPLRLDIFEPAEIEGVYPRPPRSTVVVAGTYRTPQTDDAWLNPLLLTSTNEQSSLKGGYTPYSPAPLLTTSETVEALGRGAWQVRVDTPLQVPADATQDDLAAAVATAATRGADPVEVAGGALVGQDGVNDLAAVDAEVRQQESTARGSIAPAVLSLVLVALALLMRLLNAASEIRVPELALASLRGVTARRMWALGLAEPLVVLAVAAPLGAGIGLGLGWWLTRAWLVPGLPVPLPWQSWATGALVLVAAVGVACVAVGLVVRDSLASQLSGVRRPGRSHRWTIVAQLTLVALAVAVLASKLAGGRQSDPDATDLVLPVLLAIVAGLAATRLTAWAARWWTGRRSGSRSLSGCVSARAISRRQEGTLVILPVTAAIAVAVFGAGVYDSAATWRASVAATVSPAATTWTSPLGMRETVELTRRIDPDGQWVMAAAEVQNPGVNFAVVDTDRLARVATWPATWTPGQGVSDVAAAIDPPGDVPRLTGRRLSITVDNQADTDRPLAIEARFGSVGGRPQRVYLGPFGAGETTRAVRLPACERGCPLEGMTLGGGAGTTMQMTGTIRVVDIAVDGATVPDAVDGAAWVASPDSQARSSVVDITAAGGAIDLTVDSGGAPAMARLTAGGLAPRRDVVRGVDVADEALEGLDGYGLVPVQPVSEAEGMPFVGPTGLLVDYASFTTDRPVYDNLFQVRVLMHEGAPADVRQALADRGLTVLTTLEEERRVLDQSAYALALRLYGVVAALVLLMALAGLFVSTAVQLPARRRDAAALRVVGVPRASVMSAVAREFLVVLGGAAAAGIVAGTLAQWVVLRTITLGYIEDLSTPHLVAAISPLRLALLAAVAVVVLGAAAFVSASLTVRGARGSTLRESAR